MIDISEHVHTEYYQLKFPLKYQFKSYLVANFKNCIRELAVTSPLDWPFFLMVQYKMP